MRKENRVEPYATVRSSTHRVVLNLNAGATARLRELQHKLQAQRDRKVATKEIISELLMGTLRVD